MLHLIGVIISIVTAMVLATSAGMKLRRHRICLETFETCRLPLSWLPRLAVLEGAAAAGIVVGLWWPPVGIAAASGAVIYFLVAVAAHLRVGDWNGLTAPTVVLVMSVATLVLRLTTV